MNHLINPYIKLKEKIDSNDYTHIIDLEKICLEHDQITFKLELEYKLRQADVKASRLESINEFMVYEEDCLIAYMGICDFGGDALEVNGMVHPHYRRQGIGETIFSLVKDESDRRRADKILLLSDHRSTAGLQFIKSLPGVQFAHSEYEMYLQNQPKPEQKTSEVILKKATNSDAKTIERLNSICFEDEYDEEKMLMPEEEEKCGMKIYMAEVNNIIIGKIHLEVSADVAGIYGFGVLPEYRKKGYGRAILNKAINLLQEDQYKNIMLQVNVKNEKALDLYRSCGFECTSTMDYYELNRK